jgi:capsid assembly protease
MAKTKRYPHLLSQIFNQPMMMTEDLMSLAVRFANTHLGLGAQLAPMALNADINDDDDDDGEESYQVANGVAVIGVYGPLVPRAGGLDMCQTMTSYESINQQLAQALADDSVSQIVFDIDSGGGAVTGAFECAAKIADSTKPTTAIVNYSAYSAAYLIASACHTISISQTGGVGSIGVIAEHVDYSKANEDAGIKITTIYRGDNKNNMSPNAPLDDRSLAQLNQMVDSSYQAFVNFVATMRGMDPQAVINTQAGLFKGSEAIAAGLADTYQDPQDALRAVVMSAAQAMPQMLRIESPAQEVSAATQEEVTETKAISNLKLRAKALKMKF